MPANERNTREGNNGVNLHDGNVYLAWKGKYSRVYFSWIEIWDWCFKVEKVVDGFQDFVAV